MRRALRNALLSCIVLGTLCAAPARAFDPITMILFGIAREIMYEAFENSLRPRQPNEQPLPEVYPGTMVEPRKLHDMIDESFFYLSERRRDEIFLAFHEELIKPKNAVVRASMIQYFTERAYAVRNAIDRLSKLTEPEMRQVTAQFAAQVRTLTPEERLQLGRVLDEGLLPVPPDLNRMLVVAVAEIPQPSVDQASANPQPTGKDAPSRGPQAQSPVRGPATFRPLSVMPGAQQASSAARPAPAADVSRTAAADEPQAPAAAAAVR
jgi:hypothetical protein